MQGYAALVAEPSGRFEIVDVEFETPRADEVLVALTASGVCHSDAICRDQVYPVPFPLVLGHEGAGVVEAVGADVRHVRPGDPVVLTFLSCGGCLRCRSGEPSYCTTMFERNFGATRSDGTSAGRRIDGEAINTHFFGQSSFASHSVANARNLVRIDPEAPIGLLGPFGCGFQTGAGTVLNALRPRPGSSLAVFGAGSVGLSALLAARIAGCTEIIAVDVNRARLELASELGATRVVNGGPDAVDELRELTCGGVDHAVESTALPHVLTQAVEALALRGSVAIVGGPAPGTEVTLDVNTLLLGRTVRGVVQGDSEPHRFIPALIDLYQQGRFPIDQLLTTYDLGDIEQAFTDMHQGSTVKPILQIAR